MKTQSREPKSSEVAAEAQFQLVCAKECFTWIEAIAMSIEAAVSNEDGIKPDILALANLARYLSYEQAASAEEAVEKFKAIAEKLTVKRG